MQNADVSPLSKSSCCSIPLRMSYGWLSLCHSVPNGKCHKKKTSSSQTVNKIFRMGLGYMVWRLLPRLHSRWLRWAKEETPHTKFGLVLEKIKGKVASNVLELWNIKICPSFGVPFVFGRAKSSLNLPLPIRTLTFLSGLQARWKNVQPTQSKPNC